MWWYLLLSVRKGVFEKKIQIQIFWKSTLFAVKKVLTFLSNFEEIMVGFTLCKNNLFNWLPYGREKQKNGKKKKKK